MDYIALFFCGAFFCNCIPHLAAGLRGESFPTLFARPRGIGKSSPIVNFLWGTANLAFALRLLFRHPFSVGLTIGCGVALAGFLVLGLYLSHRFGKVRAGKRGPLSASPED